MSVCYPVSGVTSVGEKEAQRRAIRLVNVNEFLVVVCNLKAFNRTFLATWVPVYMERGGGGGVKLGGRMTQHL